MQGTYKDAHCPCCGFGRLCPSWTSHSMLIELIIKRKLRFPQLAGIKQAEIIVLFNREEIKIFWEDNEP